ncbi:MAG: hypothetical protein Q9227_000862 [Pyrenula ochraceoflavens]
MTIVPAVPQVMAEFGVTKAVYSTLVVSIWELGEGIGPFLVAPLSELLGRAIVYHVGNCLFVLCLVVSATSSNMSMLIAFRFLNGLSTTSLTLAPAIIGDLFVQEERGAAMAMAVLFPLAGPVAAPIVGGYVAEAKGWRWAIWVIAIAVGILTFVSLIFIRETYYPIILQRQNKARRKTGTEDSQDTPARSYRTKSRSIFRPVRMLFFSPMIFALSFFTAVTYGMSYLIMTTLTEIFESLYGFTQGSVGLVFLGQAAGMILALLLYGTASDAYLKHTASKTSQPPQPESRLLFMLIGSLLLPLGFFTYGWTLHFHHHIPFLLPVIATSLVGASSMLTMLPTENYLVDAYDDYSASAIAIGVIMRAVVGAVLPLAGPALYEKLGYGWGNSLLGGVAVGFVPVVAGLFLRGQGLRGDAKHWKD